nr:MAG TPA: hypothetical protein [Caudoviricetes sp.]
MTCIRWESKDTRCHTLKIRCGKGMAMPHFCQK